MELRTEDEENTIIVQPNTANKNGTEQATKPVKKRGRSRPRKNAVSTSATYITTKEKADYNLSLKLC